MLAGSPESAGSGQCRRARVPMDGHLSTSATRHACVLTACALLARRFTVAQQTRVSYISVLITNMEKKKKKKKKKTPPKKTPNNNQKQT